MPTLLAVAALLVAGTPPAAPAAKPDGRAAFEALKRLEGNWKADGKEVTYLALRVIAGGSAVLETTTGADKTKIVTASVYSLDGGELVATHFSGAANPRLRLKSVEGRDLRFELTSVGNLTSPAASHMTGVAFLVKDDDHLTQEWENLAAGKSAKLVFAFQREYVDTLK